MRAGMHIHVAHGRHRINLNGKRRCRPVRSNLGLLRHPEDIVDLNAEIANCAFQLRMSEQRLHRPKLFRPPVDQRSFCAAHRVGAVQNI
jgi:hypothetical protein